MKRMAAVAVCVALFALPVCAQHGGGHGGFSGSRGGASGFHGGGFSGFHGMPSPHGGFTGPNRSSFNGFRGYAPGRIGGPTRFGGYHGPYLGRRPLRPGSLSFGRGFAPTDGLRTTSLHQGYAGFRPPYTGATRRAPYRSPNGGDRGRRDHRGRDHDRGNFYGLSGWAGYPILPWVDWGYPYYPDSFDDSDDYDSQSDSNDTAAQPYPYGPPQSDENDQQQTSPYASWPYSQPATSSTQPASSGSQASGPSEAEAPLTVIFKDGRHPEKIHNYMLTASKLYVLDQHREVIPVSQIDLAATTKVNLASGIEFALPGGQS